MILPGVSAISNMRCLFLLLLLYIHLICSANCLNNSTQYFNLENIEEIWSGSGDGTLRNCCDYDLDDDYEDCFTDYFSASGQGKVSNGVAVGLVNIPGEGQIPVTSIWGMNPGDLISGQITSGPATLSWDGTRRTATTADGTWSSIYYFHDCYEEGCYPCFERGHGDWSATLNLPPVAFMTYSPDSQILQNTLITFDASLSSDTDGTIMNYYWDFGDGNSSEGKIATYAYAKPGEYDVTLTVKDNVGQNGSYEAKLLVTLPIILVYGWHGTAANWALIEPWLKMDGFVVDILNFDDSQHADIIAENALKPKIEAILNKYKTNKVDKVDIISHSFGGLISRYYIERLNGNEKVRNLIMLATPNHGSRLADYLTGYDPQYKDLVDIFMITYASFLRPDSKWGSSLDLRTMHDSGGITFTEDLNSNFKTNKKDTNYFTISGIGHYPDKYPSTKSLLEGHDDSVVALSSAKLDNVPNYCVDLSHSSIVDPRRERK